MKRLMNLKEAFGTLAVVGILAGLPLTLWWWRAVKLPHSYPPGTKVITLTATANGGIWTQENLVGYNYWWHKPARTGEIPLNQGDHVVVRVRSSDLLHSFAIPLLHIGPVDVPAGHTVEVPFEATRPGVLTFLCWQVCSMQHDKLRGRFVVKSSGAAPEGW
jgi:heme/copper-type cytochrome/quinol oxidase subunit 2